MFENIIALLFLLFWVMIVFALIYISFDDEIKGFLNKRKGALKDIHKLLTPKTPIQKEIESALKEIEQLEQQKKDIDKLKELKQRRKQLFKEVVDYEVESEIDNVICVSCGNYMNYRGIDRSRREIYECKSCNLTLKTPLYY